MQIIFEIYMKRKNYWNV